MIMVVRWMPVGQRMRRLMRFIVAAGFVVCAALPRAFAEETWEVDRILVLKQQRVLQLMSGDTVINSFPIALGPHPKGTKHRLGDGRTPEGIYVIDGRSTDTPYHLKLHISYPGAADQDDAAKRHVDPGGAIFIHGMPARFGHTDPVRFFRDWTDGCIAVGNVAIEEIWNAIPDGTEIEIRP